MNKIEEFKTQLNDTLDSWVVQGKELNFKECIIEEIIDNLKSIIQQAVSEQKEKDAEIVEMITPVIDCGKYPDIDSKIVADTNYQLTRQIAKAIREQ